MHIFSFFWVYNFSLDFIYFYALLHIFKSLKNIQLFSLHLLASASTPKPSQICFYFILFYIKCFFISYEFCMNLFPSNVLSLVLTKLPPFDLDLQFCDHQI